MEHLDIGEKRYMKVSSAARETGYTMDYIGQLCRGKKIDAKLVGRTWYVAYDELLAHRQTRGRSSFEKAKKAFKKEVVALEGETRIPINLGHTGVRKRLVSEHITYQSDEAELIPTKVAITTPQEVPEQKILVKKDADERAVKFNTEEKPEIQWNGTIVVQPLQEAEDEITSNTKSDTAPLTRHVHVRNTEKMTTVAISATESLQDPLLQRERFLSKVNRAHDLNSLEAALEKKSLGETEQSHIPASVQRKTAGIHPLHTWIYNASLVLFISLVCVGISGVFIEHRSVYISGTDTNNNIPFYQKGLSFATAKEIQNNTLATISNIRDMFIIKD